MDYHVLTKVCNWLDERDGCLSDEDIHYGRILGDGVDYPCTVDEFVELHSALESIFDCVDKCEEGVVVSSSGFPIFEKSFVYAGFQFVWWLMIGQGSAIRLCSAKHPHGRSFQLDRGTIIVSKVGESACPGTD